MKSNTVKDRLIQYIKSKGLDIKSFEVNAGLANGFISKTGINIRRASINKIIEAYPELNTEWVITGQGDMLINSKEKAHKHAPNAILIGNIDYPIESGETPFVDLGNGQKLMIVPLVNEYAYAGYMSGYRDPEYIEYLPKHTIVVSKEHTGIYNAFEVVGDSMENDEMPRDSIYDGSIVTGHYIQKHHWKSKLHTHRWKDWVIVHKEGILIKRIKEHQVSDGLIILESLNPNKDLYPDRKVHLDDVYQLFSIVNVSQPR